ncbi:MAG: EamA family transporter [Lachnospiraceae bacterium]|nr:EamA family transporter [Lachnospiraceae bacterium]
MRKENQTIMRQDLLFSNKYINIIIMLIVCALWGSLFPIIKIGYSAFHIMADDIPTIILFAGLRFVISGIILIGVSWIKAGNFKLPAKIEFSSIFLVGLTSIILHYGFTYIGLSLGEGSKSAIIKQVGFLFLSCFAFLFEKEDKFKWPKFWAGILGFAGIIVTSMDGVGLSFRAGDMMLIMASLCSVASNVISKQVIKRINPIQLVAYSQFIGGVCLCIAGLFLGGKIEYMDWKGGLVFAYICFASITAYSLWNVLLKYNDLSKMSVIKFTEPLFAVIFSGVLLGESIFRVSYLIAFVIIFVAILLSNVKINKEK